MARRSESNFSEESYHLHREEESPERPAAPSLSRPDSNPWNRGMMPSTAAIAQQAAAIAALGQPSPAGTMLERKLSSANISVTPSLGGTPPHSQQPSAIFPAAGTTTASTSGITANPTPRGLNQVSSFDRLQAVREASAKDKMVLMQRIEELSEVIHSIQLELKEKQVEVEEYHRVFGTLNDFTSRQVQQKEELLALRGALRQWQEREQTSREEARRLHSLLDQIKRGSKHDSTQSRLADLEDRLAHAHLQRMDLGRELEAAKALRDAKESQQKLFPDAALRALSGTDWELRGRVADLERQANQKETLILSLEKALHELREVVKQQSNTNNSRVGGGGVFAGIQNANQHCPGCGEPQWTSPFCPKTGHRHLGFGPTAAATFGKDVQNDGEALPPLHTVPTGAFGVAAATAVDTMKKEGSSPTRPDSDTTVMSPSRQQRSLVFVPPSPEELAAEAAQAVNSGAWQKLVQIGSFDLRYKEVSSGLIVSDLPAELLLRRRRNFFHGVSQLPAGVSLESGTEKGNKTEEHLEGKTERVPPFINVRPNFANEVRMLLEQLKVKNAENAKLKKLLYQVAKSGQVGWKPPTNNQQTITAPGQTPSAGPGAKGSTTPLPPGVPPPVPMSTSSAGIDGEDHEKLIASAAEGMRGLPIPLHDEDDVMTTIKLQRLAAENAALNNRCTELVVLITERDERISALQSMLKPQEAPSDKPGSIPALQKELAELRDRLLKEEGRSLALEDEVRRLRRVGR